jgi:hypothetical protein
MKKHEEMMKTTSDDKTTAQQSSAPLRELTDANNVLRPTKYPGAFPMELGPSFLVFRSLVLRGIGYCMESGERFSQFSVSNTLLSDISAEPA